MFEALREDTCVCEQVRGHQARRSWRGARRSHRFESAMAEAVGTAALSQQAAQRSRDLRARLQQRRHNLQKVRVVAPLWCRWTDGYQPQLLYASALSLMDFWVDFCSHLEMFSFCPLCFM